MNAHYPSHEPRENDPHYAAFDAFRRSTIDTAVCWWSVQTGIRDKCSGGMELHHGVAEYAAINAIDPKLLDAEFPDAGSTRDEIDAWVNSSPESLVWLCEHHHRSHESGIHSVPYAIYRSSLVAPSLLT